MPEDVLQDVFLRAWRDRHRMDWRGTRAFRSWLLTVIDNRIRDLADFESAQKRGGDRKVFREADSAGFAGGGRIDPAGTTTPSRIASYREQAELMRATVEGLPEELRQVVWMRLFEQRQLAEIAELLDISQSAVRYRLRKGSEMYQRRFLGVLATQSHRALQDSVTVDAPDSASSSR